MDTIPAVLSIAAAITLGAMSPGPSFLMVARAAIARSRADGLAAALGMGVGGVLFACAALLGLHVVLIAVPWFYLVLKILGGAYLIFIGVMIWRGAREPVTLSERTTRRARTIAPVSSFWLALATQMSNPKAAVVYASVFVALLPPRSRCGRRWSCRSVIFAIEAGWYAIVALALSAPSPRAPTCAPRPGSTARAGTVMALLGLRLILATK